MNKLETQIVAVERPAPPLDQELMASSSFAPPMPAHPNELRKVHRMLRGRYKWAILLSIVLGSGASYAGYRLGRKTFQSSGVVQVLPSERTVLYRNDDKDGAPDFDAYVDAQVARLRGQTVLENAMDDPRWVALGQKKTDESKMLFAKALDVTKQGGMIWVKYTDLDPQAAMIAVNSIMDAFERSYTEAESKAGDLKQQIREELKTRKENELGALQKQIFDIAEIYGDDDLKPRLAAKLAEYNTYAILVQQTEIARVANTRSSAKDAPAPARIEISDSELAVLDPRVALYQNELESAQQKVDLLQTQGIGERNNQMTVAKANLDAARKKLQEYMEESRTLRSQGRSISIDSRGLTSEELNAKLNDDKRLRDEANAEVIRIGKQELEIRRLQEQVARVKSEIEDASKAIEHTRVELPMAGRASIFSAADRPLEAYRDTRPIFAGAGAVAAILIGFGSMLLVGFSRRRLDRPEDAESGLGDLELLGVLPQLPDDLSDPEQAAIASHCVHMIRTRLQILSQGHMHQVVVVTSPTAGTGKTSLTLAMGVSYAAAHLRTLMIDCDLVGGGLTSKCDAIVKRKIGKILQRDAAITKEQLNDALKLAHGSPNRLGEMLVELGVLDEETLTRAVATQEAEPIGILDALAGEDIEACITETGVEGLYVLPLGGATAQHVGRLSPASLRRLLDRARKSFDILLIDTGPVAGSLEASIVASEADQVILAVSRGDTSVLAEKAAMILSSVGARVCGIVFNRARRKDVEVYGSSGFTSSNQRMRKPGSPSLEMPSRLGPIGRAVASSSATRSSSEFSSSHS